MYRTLTNFIVEVIVLERYSYLLVPTTSNVIKLEETIRLIMFVTFTKLMPNLVKYIYINRKLLLI